MASVRVETFVAVPPEVVYAAVLSPSMHARTASGRERVVRVGRADPTPSTWGTASSHPSADPPPQGEGLRLGDEVTFEATHFGVRQRLTARITLADPPHAIEDTMVRGAFRSLWHRHEFHMERGGTRMVDEMVFRSPLGALFDGWVLAPYLRQFLERRGSALAGLLESGR